MSQTNSRSIILNSALKLFSEKGYDAVGVNEISNAAEVKKPTLYYFFQNKEGLFRAIMEEVYQPFLDQLASVSKYHSHPSTYEQDVLPLLTRIFDFSLQYADENPEFYRLMLSLMYAPPVSLLRPVYGPYLHRHEQIFIQIFNAIAQVHHNLKSKESLLAISWMGIIHAHIAWMIDESKTKQNQCEEECMEDIHKRSREIVHQFMHGIFA